MSASFILTILAASGSLAYPVISARQSSGCATGVHMIVARGSGEAAGEGVESSVVSAVQKSISGSDGVGIDYPASLSDYLSSEGAGVTAMTQDLQNYSQQCPDTKIALLGFSQGAQVVGDVLGGGALSNSAPIDKQYTKNVIAAILFGDPSHVAGKSYDVGTSTNNGMEPRSNTATLDTYSDILQSYCDSGDEFCDNGGNAQVHAMEVTNHASAAAQFIVSKAQGAGSSPSSGNGSTPTSSDSGSPSPTSGSTTPTTPTSGSGFGGGFPTSGSGGFPTPPSGFPSGFPTGTGSGSGFPSGGFPTLPSGFPKSGGSGFPTGGFPSSGGSIPTLPSGISIPGIGK